MKEYEYFKTHSINEPRVYCNNNSIIKYFQQNIFFSKERELWKDNIIRNKLIGNRMKFLNKKEFELTANDIISGFKRSGIYYGYSHFNPLLFKWFIRQYDIKTCYDRVEDGDIGYWEV